MLQFLALPVVIGVLLYRRPGNGARLQLRETDDAHEAIQDGWQSAEPALAIVLAADALALVPATDAVCLVNAPAVPEADRPSAQGRKRKEWGDATTDDIQESESLRKAANRWLKEKGVLHQPLSTTTQDRQHGLIGKCGRCVSCAKAYCFTEASKGNMSIEQVGECSGPKDLKRIRAHNAKKYGDKYTPGRAIVKMRTDGVPQEERPTDAALKAHRPKKHKGDAETYPAECVGQLREFLEHPPAGIHVYTEHVICTEKQVRIPFSRNAAQDVVDSSRLPSFLLDFTFKTNEEGLLLGAVGPVGLHCPKGAPQMRFLPFFVSSVTQRTNQHTDCASACIWRMQKRPVTL
jgi:hypothetical protein